VLGEQFPTFQRIPEDENITLLQNNASFLSSDIATHPRRLQSSNNNLYSSGFGPVNYVTISLHGTALMLLF
jgi:hypothetical protein